MIYQKMANPRAHDVASQATDSMRCARTEGPSIYWITEGNVLNLQLRPSIYMRLFRRNVPQIALNPTKNLSIESL